MERLDGPTSTTSGRRGRPGHWLDYMEAYQAVFDKT